MKGKCEPQENPRRKRGYTQARKIVISVKGGKLKADDVRALMAVRTREKADFAFLISLNNPTAGMKKDAFSAGSFEWRSIGGTPTGKKSHRIQLFTIEGLMSGSQRPDFPDFDTSLNAKKAKREIVRQTVHLFEGASIEPEMD